MTRRYADLENGSFGSLGYGRLPFRQAVRHGDVVYVTGQVAVEDKPSPMPQQTRIAMANMKAVLAQVGATMADVVQTTSYYVGLDGLQESALIQSRQFPSDVASTAVVVPALVEPRFLVEIEAIAVVGARKDVARLPGRDPLGVPSLRPARPFDVGTRSTCPASSRPTTTAPSFTRAICPGRLAPRWNACRACSHSSAPPWMMSCIRTSTSSGPRDGRRRPRCGAGSSRSVRRRPGSWCPPWPRPAYLIQIDAIAVVDTPKQYADAPTPNVVKKLRLDVPFRQGVKCGNTIYTSGQVALGENGEALHPTDIARQTRVAMENIKALLAEFGATTEDVVRKNTYYVGVSDFRKTVPIRAEYFKTGICATGVGVDGLGGARDS